MTVHKDQVASVLRRAVQDILSRGLNDPRIGGLVSVTGVKVTDDMAGATVMVSILPEEKAQLSMHGLRHAASHVRMELTKHVKMRRVPHITFVLDKSLKNEARVLAAINEARRGDREAGRSKDQETQDQGSES